MTVQVDFDAAAKKVGEFENSLAELQARMRAIQQMPELRLHRQLLDPLLKLQVDMAKASMGAMRELANGQKALQAQLAAGAVEASKAAAASSADLVKAQAKAMEEGAKRTEAAWGAQRSMETRMYDLRAKAQAKALKELAAAQAQAMGEAEKVQYKAWSDDIRGYQAMLKLKVAAQNKAAAENLKAQQDDLAGYQAMLKLKVAAEGKAQAAAQSADLQNWRRILALREAATAESAASARRVLGNTAKSQINNATLAPSGAYPSLQSGAKFGLVIDPAAAAEAESAKNKDKLDAAARRAAAGLREKAKATSEGAKAAAQAGGPLRTLTNHLTDVHSAARGVASGFGMMWLTWGKVTPLLAGAALSNSLVQTAQNGKEFETVLAGIEYMGGASAGEIRKLSAAALELGANSKYAPIEVAQGLKVLTLAGLNATESLQALKPMLNFATVSELPLDKAAESLLGISKAFGYTAAEVSVSGDVVAKAAAVSMSSVSDMTEAFKQSSTVAQQFGVTIQDQSVGLALLAQIGIRGSAAGTALRNMYVELMGSSKKARKVLEETLNVNIFDNATKAVKPLSTILTDLAKSLSGKTFEAQTNILNALGNERGMKMISAGLSGIQKAAKEAGVSTEEFLSQFAKLQQELEDAPGFMAIAAAGMAATTENIMKSVSGSLQSSMIKAFEEMSPYLINFSVSLREVFQSPEFIQGLKDLVRFVGEAAQGFASAVKFVWEYRDAILAAGAGLLALKASTTILGVMSAATAAAAGTVRTLTAAFLIAGPAGFAGAAGATAMAGAVNLLKVALGPIAIALSAAAAAYYYFSDSAADASKKQAQEVIRNNEEMKKSLEAKRTMTLEAMDKEIERLQVYIKHKGDEKKINEEMKKLSDEASVSAVNSTIQKLLDMAQQEEAIKRVDAATKRVLAAEIERDRLHGGGGSLEYVERLRKEADALDEQGRMIRAKGEFEANVARQRQVYMSKQAKEAAGIANTNASNRRKPPTGDEGYNPDDKKGRDSIDTKIRLDAEQVTARYRIEMESIASGETLKANLLKSLHSNKLIMDGEFAAREIALVESTELRKLEVISRSRAEYEKKHEADIDSLESQRRKFITENSGKKGFDDKYAKYVADLVDKFDDLHAKRETHLQDFDKEAEKVNDSAIQRWAAQVDAAAGRIKALKEASRGFWHQESVNLAKQGREDGVEDALRYASPERAAVIQAQSAAYEQYASQIETLSYDLSKAEENHDAMTAAIDDSLLAMVAEGMKEEDVAKVKELLYAAEKADLDEIIAKRERLGELQDVQGEMVRIQGDRALTKFKKDEEAQLVRGVANAIETGLFEGGKAGKKKLRDIIVAELRKPVSLLINAIINPIMGAMLGSLGIGSAAAGQAGGSLVGSAAAPAIGGMIPGIGTTMGHVGSGAYTTMSGWFGGGAPVSAAAGSAGSTAFSVGQYVPYVAVALLALNALGVFRSKKIVGGGLTGTLGSGDISSYDLQRKGGTLFSGPSYSVVNQQKSQFSEMIQSDWKLATASVVSMAESLGLATDAAKGFTATLGTDVIHPDTGGLGINLDDLRGKDLTQAQYAQEVQNRINEAIRSGSEELAQKLIGSWETTTETISKQVQVVGTEGEVTWQTVTETVTSTNYVVSEYARSSETALETLTRLSTSLVTANQAFSMLGFTLFEASLAGGDAASKFADLFGGVDKMSSQLEGYYNNFYSEAEKSANATRILSAQLKVLGIDTLPTTKEAYRDLVEGAMKSGNTQLAADLIKLSAAFDATKESARELTAAYLGVTDSNAQKYLTTAAYKDYLYKRGAQQLSAVGLSFTEEQLRDATPQDIKAYVVALAQAGTLSGDALAKVVGLADGLIEAKTGAAGMSGALDKLTAAIEREKEALQKQLNVAQEAYDAAKALFDLLKTNIDELRNSVSSTKGMSAAAGNAFIDNAIANYQATGYLPDQAGLSEAIAAAREGNDSGQYSTSLEYERAQLILANKLDILKMGAEDHMTIAEKQLAGIKTQIEQLDKTLEYWKQQIELAQGGIDATMTVTDAVNALAALFDKSKNPGGGSGGSGGGGGGGSGTFTTGLGGTPANARPFSKEDVYASVQAELNTKGIYAANWRWVDGIGGGMAAYDRITDPDLIAQYDAIRDFGQQLYESNGGGADGAWAVYNAAIQNGVTSDQVATAFGMTPEQFGGYLDMYGIPSFAVGTNRILRDGPAYLHKDEAVVPAAFNPALHFNQQNQAYDQLAAENVALRASMEHTNRLLERVARASEKTERAMTNVTEGGAGMVLSTPVLAL